MASAERSSRRGAVRGSRPLPRNRIQLPSSRVELLDLGSCLAVTTARLTFSVGVSSPLSCERSAGRIAIFLTCSTRAKFLLISSTWASIEALTSGLAASCVGVLGEAVLLGVGGGLFGVEGDQGDQVGAAVADDDALGDQRVLLDLGLEVGRGDVLAAGGDDDVLFAAGDLDEAVGVDLADVAGVQPAVDDRLAGSPPRSCGSPGRRWGP